MARQPTPDYMTSVQLSKLSLAYAGQCFLRDIDLRVDDGEYFAILGASGCGKTSILRAIAGLLRPQQGDILLNGQNVVRSAPRKRPIALVPQSEGLYPQLSVQKSISAGIRQRISRAEKAERALQAARAVGIESILHRTPDQISGGQAKRACLAKALASGARIRLFDEPLSAIDAHLRHSLERDLKQVHQQIGGITLHVTHDSGEAFRLADRIGVIGGGRVVQVDSPKDLRQCPVTLGVAALLGISPIVTWTMVRSASGWNAESPGSDTLRFGPNLPVGSTAIVAFYEDDLVEQGFDKAALHWRPPADTRSVPVNSLRWFSSATPHPRLEGEMLDG